ncbi:hypothetical protein Srot_2323 [Segniliparus rotundus DSM 44985]|uniref:Uncharacterized protein n=1 Tax=Segniliparus rotundus (strain ATCC BAA-972 / CDC 1076 / CIP 108378 / DSM 44985 / JCM 13578) TaxID=640132 RepID=D6ZAN6_SEGRD|nr:hypothetical protein [Segniliparus rotundus]ADG98772.1 hypothetical protein Srot_2323 [Segniliparus rotundus DSM 44985]
MHQHVRNTSSSKPRPAQTAAALFALVSSAWLWSSAAAHADPHEQAPMKPAQLQGNDDADGPDDDLSSEDPGQGRNPYVSGPLANVGGPSSDEGQQDIGQTLDSALGGDGQGDGIGQSIGDILGTGPQGVGADGIAQAVGGLLQGAQSGGADKVGEAIGGLLGASGDNQGVMGSGLLGGSSSGDGQSDGQVPEAVRKGVIRLNRALGDTGYNSDPDSRGAGSAANGDQNEPHTGEAGDDED